MSENSITLEVPEMKAFLDELFQLPLVIRERVMIGAVASGAAVIKDEAVQRAPLYTGSDAELMGLVGRKAHKLQTGHPPPGTLKRSIYQVRLKDRCSPWVEVWKVDVRRGQSARVQRGKNKGKRMLEKDAFYALWVEYGHYTRTPNTSSKQHRAAVKAGTAMSLGAKWVPAQPFMRPAFEVKKAAALKAMQDYLEERLPAATDAFKFLKMKAAA